MRTLKLPTALVVFVALLITSQWVWADFDVKQDAFSITGGRDSGEEGAFTVYQMVGQPAAGLGAGGSWEHNSGFLPTIIEYIIDLAPPQLMVGVLAGTETPTQLSIYVSASEVLGNAATGTFTLTRPGGEKTITDEVLTKLDNHDAIYYTRYELLFSGLLEMVVTGSDVYGNEGNITRFYNVESLNSNRSFELESEDGTITVRGDRGSVITDGFLLLDRAPVLTHVDQRDGIVLSAAYNEPTVTETVEIVAPFRLFSTVAFARDVEVSVGFDAGLLADVAKETDYDERKVGLYRLSGDEWRYVGGESAANRVSTDAEGVGVYTLRYNSEHTVLPTTTELYQNYPNPFNPTTTIRFALTDDSPVRLTIYNVRGQRVRTLVDSVEPAGYHTYTWQGRNDSGEQVATGVYLYRLEAGENVFTKKMVLLK